MKWVTYSLKLTPTDNPSCLRSDSHTCLTYKWPWRLASNKSDPIRMMIDKKLYYEHIKKPSSVSTESFEGHKNKNRFTCKWKIAISYNKFLSGAPVSIYYILTCTVQVLLILIIKFLQY